MNHPFSDRRYRTRVMDVCSKIPSFVDPRDYPVDSAGEMMQPKPDAVGRSAVNGEVAFAPIDDLDAVSMTSDAVATSRKVGGRCDALDRAKWSDRVVQSFDTWRVEPVVIRQQESPGQSHK